MSDDIHHIETTIEVATKDRPAVVGRKIEFSSGEVVSMDVPLKGLGDANSSLAELHQDSISRVISLLQELIPQQQA